MPFPLLVAAIVVIGRVAVVVVVRAAPVIIKAAPRIGKEVVKKGGELAKKGNTRLNKYRDKAMEKLSKACQKAVKKLGGHIHGRKGDVIEKGSGKESNHILQNALFEGIRGDGSSICSGYKDSRAPAIPLDKETHDAITRRQGEWARQHRKAGTQPTVDEARKEARNQTRMAGANRKEAECLMKFVDQVMEQLCPELMQSNKSNTEKLRTPGTRSGNTGGGKTKF